MRQVPNEPPVSDPNGPYSAQVGETITFDGSGSTDPDGSIASYAWAFGDGSTGTGVNPTHAYATAGTFTVSLMVTDNDGATNTASTTATIAEVPNEPPVSDPNGPYSAQVGAGKSGRQTDQDHVGGPERRSRELCGKASYGHRHARRSRGLQQDVAGI
jgi:PKD repeat protein